MLQPLGAVVVAPMLYTAVLTTNCTDFISTVPVFAARNGIVVEESPMVADVPEGRVIVEFNAANTLPVEKTKKITVNICEIIFFISYFLKAVKTSLLALFIHF